MTTELTIEQTEVLDNVISSQGDCMNGPYASYLCEKCPIRRECYFDMITITTTARRRDHRYKLAANKLLEITVLGFKES